VLVGYRIPGAASREACAADLLARMLVSEKTGPLHEAVVGKGLAAEVSIDSFDLRMPSPYYAVATVPRDRDPEAVESAVIEVFERKAGSLGSSDLERARSLVERDYDRVFNDTEALATLLSEYEAAGSWMLFVVQREQAKSVSLDEVRSFAARYLKRENRVVGRFVPDATTAEVVLDPEPSIDHYRELLAKVPVGAEPVRKFSYDPENLQAALSWLSPGGAKIGLIRKETKGGDVFIRFWIPFGDFK